MLLRRISELERTVSDQQFTIERLRSGMPSGLTGAVSQEQAVLSPAEHFVRTLEQRRIRQMLVKASGKAAIKAAGKGIKAVPMIELKGGKLQ